MRIILTSSLAAALLMGCSNEEKYVVTGSVNAEEAVQKQQEAAKKLNLPVEQDIDIGGGVKMKMVLIPAGEFIMGSPETEKTYDAEKRKMVHPEDETQHRVQITKAFYMGATEVTQAQYVAVMGGRGFNKSKFRSNDLPVENVTWLDTQEFLTNLSEKTNKMFRLPSEAEWEYACRACSTTPFAFGGTLNTDQANYDGGYVYGDGVKGEIREKTSPVGSLQPNAWGLYDMHGNVMEWCNDWYDENYYNDSPEDDPQGPEKGGWKVIRGGAWKHDPGICRSAHRMNSAPDEWDPSKIVKPVIGFRVVFTVETKPAQKDSKGQEPGAKSKGTQ
jgi:formylglycine-generating enzyme required for sulfatase activity